MAATVSSVWAKPGAGSWALDSEENEAELQKQEQTHQPEAPAADFPSLSAAVSSKTKKKKGQTLSLAEFATYTKPKGNTFQPSFQSKGLTHEDMLALPTGPRERTAEELEQGRLGGGFRSYGGGRDRNSGDDSSNSRWGSNSRGGGDEPRRSGGGFGRDSSMEFAPSRADEIDNWAEGKKSGFGGGGFERRERGGSGGGFFDSQSKADDSDSWVSNKSVVPTEGRRFGGGGFERERRGGFEFNNGGGGFERERRGGFESHNGGGADLESWGKKIEEVSVVENGSSSRPKLNLQPRTLPVCEVAQQAPAIVAKPKGSNPFGAARPREEVLAEKGQDWKKIDEQLDSMKIKETTFGIGDADGPVSEVAQQAPAIVVKPKGSNPFGAARPREEVLAEKGQDWKKIDEQLDSMKIKETTLSVGDADGPVKNCFGAGTDRRSSPENHFERSWRKPESVDVRPQSAEKVDSAENGVTKED